MSITTFEGKVKNGQIVLSEKLSLPEETEVYVVVPKRSIRKQSSKLADSIKTADLKKKIEEENDSDNGPKRKTLWEMVKHIIEEVPDEEWEKIPADASLNLDHYLYGSPKRVE